MWICVEFIKKGVKKKKKRKGRWSMKDKIMMIVMVVGFAYNIGKRERKREGC